MAASWLCALLLATAHGFLAPHSILPGLSRAALPDALADLHLNAPAVTLDGASSLLVAEGENYVSFAIGILFFSAIAFYAAIVLTPPVDRSKRD